MGDDKAASLSASNDEEHIYWARARSDSLGIVVATAWMLSKPRHLNKHTHLYATCDLGKLIAKPGCRLIVIIQSNFIKEDYQGKIHEILVGSQLGKIFVTPRLGQVGSGGIKACLYQILKILDECYGGVDSTLTKYRIVRDWYAGQIHDSSPPDFVSSGGVNFVSNPSILGLKKKSAAITWSAKAVAKTLDLFFLSRWERERADMWNIIYKAGAWGPVLVLCSKDDELTPFEVIEKYTSRLTSVGSKVTMTVWDHSPHVGHLKTHPDEYKSAVAAFLSDAAGSFKVANTSHHDGSITESMTSSFKSGGRIVVLRSQNSPSERLESQTSGNARVGVLIPSRM